MTTDEQDWHPIATAPRGGGAARTDDPAYITPPKLLLACPDGMVIAAWDWYYAPSGNGYEGCSAWVEPISGVLVAKEMAEPTHWMPLPAPPDQETDQ